MRRILTAAIALAFLSTAADPAKDSTALVHMQLPRGLTVGELVGRNIDIIAAYRDGTYDLAVTDEQLEWLGSHGAPVTLLERAGLLAPLELDANLGEYHTYDEMNTMLDDLVSTYPDLTRMDTIGTTWEGRLIRAVKISDNADIDEGEAEVLIMGCHHARELMSVEVPLLFAEYLLTHYTASPQITELVDALEIWIAPMINPDGHVYVQNNHAGDWWTWWRKNRRDNGGGVYGVDLNRNYSYMWGYDDQGSSPDPTSNVYRGPAPFSEPETQAVRDFCAGRDISLALSYHSYGDLILFPWGYAPLYTNDHGLFLTLGDSLSRGNDYYVGNTAMGAIYVTNGDTDDWAYGETSAKNRFYCYTIELNSYEEGGFAPPDILIMPTFEKVLELNLTLLRRADVPKSVLGPHPPLMNEVAALNPPNYELSWRTTHASDPNPPVVWELTEFKNLAGVVDSCEMDDQLWELDGFRPVTSRAYIGTASFHSGTGDDLRNTMTMATFYPLSFGDTLSCRLWYDIEPHWDYAYLEASLDQGLIWQTVPGDRATDDNPNGMNRGYGITGSSAGWVPAEFYLDNLGILLEGSVVFLRFSYITDAYIANEGIYVDLVSPVSTYEEKSILAAAHPDTFYHRWPEETGAFSYTVRAIDGEGHRGRLSNVVHHTVSDLTAVVPPGTHTVLPQNYPNPFNPTTTIRFTVGSDDVGRSGSVPVLLELYDVAGRRIAVLRNERLGAGTYRTTWNGTSGGQRVASGVYFMRLKVGHRVLTRKLVLLR